MAEPCPLRARRKENGMFDIFGNMTAEELNKAAEGLKNEGDAEGLKKLAEENGIDTAFAELYAQGGLEEFCDVAMAAVGKLEVEAAELKPVELVADWVEYIKTSCMDDTALAEKVRDKDKTLKGCIAALLKWSYKNRYRIDKDILEKSGIKGGVSVEMGIPGMGTAKRIIRDYYME